LSHPPVIVLSPDEGLCPKQNYTLRVHMENHKAMLFSHDSPLLSFHYSLEIAYNDQYE
jgi:hypothetical protein